MATTTKEKSATITVEQLLAGKAGMSSQKPSSIAMQRQMSQLADAAAAMIYDAEQQPAPATEPRKAQEFLKNLVTQQ